MMGTSKNTTAEVASVARFAAFALLAACSPELPPPALSAAWVGAPDFGPEAVCVDLTARMSSDYPSAPMAERSLYATPPQNSERLALGRSANAILGNTLPVALESMSTRCLSSTHEDRDAVELMLLGKADSAVATVPPSPREAGTGLASTLLGVELFGLVVHDSASVHNLRIEEARDVIDGTLVDWRQFSMDAGALRLVSSLDAAARDRALRVLAPGRSLTAAALGVDSAAEAVAEVLRDPTTIALVHVAAIPPDAPVRVLAIDGTLPSVAAFARGAYPVGVPLWLVTRGAPGGLAAELRDKVASGEVVLAEQRVCVR